MTRKPVCQVCESEELTPSILPEPPPIIPAHRGRPAEVDTSQQFCPNGGCPYYGGVSCSNIGANGHPNGDPWRQFYGQVCGRWFLETHGPVLFGKRQTIPLLLFVLAALVEGMGLRAAGRVFGLDPGRCRSGF